MELLLGHTAVNFSDIYRHVKYVTVCFQSWNDLKMFVKKKKKIDISGPTNFQVKVNESTTTFYLNQYYRFPSVMYLLVVIIAVIQEMKEI